MNGFLSRRVPESNRTTRLCRPLPNRSVNAPLEPEYGFRLASLADGEGCFTIHRTRKAGRVHWTHSCNFTVKMRADDAPFLERWQQATGVGRIYHGTGYPDAHRRNRPFAMWVVTRRTECAWLADAFAAYPLWSKKARDCEIWTEAVRFWVAPRDSQTVDQERLAELRERLRATRAYQEAAKSVL